MSLQPWICFVVPCFNEQDNVASTVQSIRSAMGSVRPFEIVLVDDGSSDLTWERMQELAQDDPRIRPVHNTVNLGLGGAYKRGVAVAQAEYVIMVPGDNGFPADSIAEIVRHAGEADVIIPVVTNPGVRTSFRAAASSAFTTLLNRLFHLDIGYYNGPVLHRTKLLRTIEIKTNSFAYQAEALVKLIVRGATYVHCYVAIQERAAGRSSALKFRNQIEVWKTIVHLVGTLGLSRRVRTG